MSKTSSTITPTLSRREMMNQPEYLDLLAKYCRLKSRYRGLEELCESDAVRFEELAKQVEGQRAMTA